MRGILFAALAVLTAPALGADNRLMVADQFDFGAKKGFYVDFENNGPDGVPLKLDSLKLILGVGDGAQWQFAFANAAFHMGDMLRIHAVIGGGKGVLNLNGSEVGSITNALSPIDAPLSGGETPGWASAPAEYRLVEHSLRVATGATAVDYIFAAAKAGGRLQLFEAPLPWTHPLTITPADTVTVDAVVTIEKPATADLSGPFIDRYGQAIDAAFDGKVHTEDAITRAGVKESGQLARWLAEHTFDRYGGLIGSPWTEKATGYYRVVKHEGMWWLITPLGTPCFYTGMCTAPDLTWDASPETGRATIWQELPPKEGDFAAAWSNNPWGDSPGVEYVGFNTVNLIRKFGTGWKAKATDEMERRLHAWGFSGLGKWCDFDPNLPSVPVLEYDAPRIGRHPDVFDPAVCDKIRTALEAQIGSHKADPNVVGWSIGNEYDEIITTDEVTAALKLPDATPLKKALLAELQQATYHGDADALAKAWTKAAPAADLETMRRFYATAYYSFLYKTVKSLDPNHLYLGFWIVPNWWVNDTDWSLIAPWCDVIGYDRYADRFGGIEELFARFDKPVLLGEFSFPCWYGGARGFGRYGVYTETERESGEKYAATLAAASRSPACIGTMWFQYRDEPLTGRGPGKGAELVIGEHYAFGFVDVTDRPRDEIVAAARAANLVAARDRLAAGR